jgi:ABC-type transport system substrate-binding protein
MAFDLSALPALLRRDVEEGERHIPAIPAEVPPAVAADPGWTRQWLGAKARLEQGWPDTTEAWDAGRRRTLGRYLAVTGYVELELIVGGCAHAVAHYEMPAAWRACLVKQAYQDMEHAASYITRGCRWSGEDYWRGIDLPYRRHVAARAPILHRDLGGFFAVIGLHTEAYPAQTNILDALMLDPVLARWTPHEIEEEAGHLGFLYPAMREYLSTGYDPAEAKRLLAAAGHPKGFQTSVCFTPYGSTVLVDTMQLVLKYLKEVGIDAKLDQKEYGAYIASCFQGKYEGVVLGPFTTFFEPYNYVYGKYTPGEPKNQGHVNAPVVTDLIDRQWRTADVARRRELLHDLQRHLAKQQYYVELPSAVAIAVWDGALRNYGPNIGNDYGGRLAAAWLDR